MDFEGDMPSVAQHLEDRVGVVIGRFQGGGIEFGDLDAVDPGGDDRHGTHAADP
ncbi:hypothetical protein AHiyo1_22850 [Arthrobacter sp. Hiyo1]|nr:hypothetical protein AHiyo1_22850 [Arthrobacter sp. Hiyo1]